MDLWGPLRLILQSIQDLQGDSSGFLGDATIARKARMPLRNVRNCLLVLHENEFISLARQGDSLGASIEPKGRVALTIPSGVPLILISSTKVLPKGLRSFDADDSTFFLDLLPGPRDRHGLPQGLSYWKDRIEEQDPEKAFRVGVLYGPSGCGKTSLLKAGLIPNLSDEILVIEIQASPDQTEWLLHKRLGQECSEVGGAGLAQALSALREGTGLPAGKSKVLLVIDQFEQWLLAHRTGDGGEFAASLKHCDGGRVQAMLMVRDDFWMALTRFMADVGVEMRQDRNCAAVDLFGPRHAKRVLKLLGEGYGALPAEDEKITEEQRDFLDEAVRELAREEKDERIASVRLALFAQMLSEKEWVPPTLRKIGGVEGVGVEFLRETFDSERGRQRHQLSARDVKGCESILEALLPPLGSDIKGGLKSAIALREKSGYLDLAADFDRLIRILDAETRLITPTEGTGLAKIPSDRPPATGVRHYQLTHDYLVPSIRKWLDSKRVGTIKGRAEIRLRERSNLWNAQDEPRNLPSVWEWARIRALTDRKDWTEPQARMMRTAGRWHGVRGLVTMLILTGGAIAVAIVGRRYSEQQQQREAAGLVQRLLDAETDKVPGIISEMPAHRPWVDPLLREVFTDPDQAGRDGPLLQNAARLARQAEAFAGMFNPERERYRTEGLRMGEARRRLHASLALLPVDPGQVDYLYERLLDAPPQELDVITNALAGSGRVPELTERLWAVVQRPGDGHEGRQLRAACALAQYDPKDVRWDEVVAPVAGELVSVSPLNLESWVEALRPVSHKLVAPLSEVYRDHHEDRSDARNQATSILADFCGNDLNMLARLALDADEKQFATLFPVLKARVSLPSIMGREDHPAGAALEFELAMAGGVSMTGFNVAKPERTEAEKDALAQKRARAAVGLVRLNLGEKVWPLLRHSPDPSVRSYLVNWLKPLGADPDALKVRLEGLGQNPATIPKEANSPMEAILFDAATSERRALILALGGYDIEDFPPGERATLTAKLLGTYCHDPDAGIHAATLWALRRWKQEPGLKEADVTLPNLEERGDRRWYVNIEGQTLAVIDGPVEFWMGTPQSEPDGDSDETLHARKLTSRFAISTTEVSVEEYARFVESSPENRRHDIGDIKKYCPDRRGPQVGASWYDAAAYCNWLSEREHLSAGYRRNARMEYAEGMEILADDPKRPGYRLPTEAEWEYACRAGAGTSRSFGSPPDLLGRYAWYSQNSGHVARPCGLQKPNDLGLFDMLGNVYEWCQDEYRAYGKDNAGPSGEVVSGRDSRVLRGGAFTLPAADVRSAYRNRDLLSIKNFDFGFRIVRPLP